MKSVSFKNLVLFTVAVKSANKQAFADDYRKRKCFGRFFSPKPLPLTNSLLQKITPLRDHFQSVRTLQYSVGIEI